jgi:hypothetical protein
MEILKYHDIECCEWTRGVDTLLARYKQDQDEVTTLIMEDPNKLVATIWKQDGPLAIDNECRCQMGNGERRSPFSCAQCTNMRRLIDFRMGGIERPFQLQCGKNTGKSLIVSATQITEPFLNWDPDSARRAQQYIQQYQSLTTCGTPVISNMKCITGDSFTIRSLIMWMIAKQFAEKGLPHIPTLHTAFICSGVGYSLYDMPNVGPMSELHKIEAYHDLGAAVKAMKSQHFAYTPLKAEIARTIIIQLLVMLLELTTISFAHGTPSIHGLIFTKDPISYLYDGVHIQGPITLQITDLWNSSATFGSNHFFPKDVKSQMCIERNLFVPEIATKTTSMAHCAEIGALQFEPSSQDRTEPCPISSPLCPDQTTIEACKPQAITLYRLTNSTMDIYNAMRHIGFPLYVGSFDFYCFMVSLMCDKSFYAAVLNDPKLYRLWSMMWLIDDLPNVERKIREAHEIEAKGETPANNRAASNTVIDIIRGAWLRCDIVKYLWSLVKMGW